MLPERWSGTTNVAWRIDIPGRGWSSPIVWRGRVFVTTAVSSGAFKAPSTGIYGNDYAAELERQGLSEQEILKRVVGRDIELTSESGAISYQVLAIDAKTRQGACGRGRRTAASRAGGRHRKNTYASETPVSDGERLYASFGGNVGLFCYTFDGELLWQRRWEPQPIYLDFGTASSPVVHDGRVYQLHDNDGDVVPHRARREDRQRSCGRSRAPMPRAMKSGWATPFVWTHDGRTEIVTIGRGLVVSYDVDGKERWRLRGMTQATPSPVAADGLLYVGSGSQGESGRPLMAIRPGAKGDISLGKESDEQRVRRVVAAALLRLHAVAAGVSGPHLRRQRQRHSAGGRRENRRRDLQSADRRRRSHLLELAAGEPGPHLSGLRRRRHPSSFAPAIDTRSWPTTRSDEMTTWRRRPRTRTASSCARKPSSIAFETPAGKPRVAHHRL